MICAYVKGYESSYTISNNGEVVSLKRNGINKNGKNYGVPARKLKPGLYNHGYLIVELCSNGENSRDRRYIHRLVAEHFVDNPENKCCVNHIDGNKLNNNYNNLEWVTVAENNQHAWDENLNTNKNRNYGIKKVR